MRTFSLLRSLLLARVIQFKKILGDQLKGRSPKKLKSLIEVPYVAHMKIQVLSLNMNLFYSPQRVPSPSYPFQDKFRRSGNVSFTEKAKIVNSGSLCSGHESTCTKLHYDPYFIPIA